MWKLKDVREQHVLGQAYTNKKVLLRTCQLRLVSEKKMNSEREKRLCFSWKRIFGDV